MKGKNKAYCGLFQLVSVMQTGLSQVVEELLFVRYRLLRDKKKGAKPLWE